MPFLRNCRNPDFPASKHEQTFYHSVKTNCLQITNAMSIIVTYHPDLKVLHAMHAPVH